MSKVDTTGWKQFRIGDVFEIELAKGDIQPKQVEDGDVPLVSAGNEDNGIVAMIDAVGDGISEIFPGGCVTVSMFGKAFYQNAPFYAVSHGRVNILRTAVPISDLSGLFIVGCLNRQFANKFGYTAMCTRTRLLSEVITLPATPAGDPDWAYMDAYMSEIMQKEEVYASHLALLTAEAVADGHKLDTSGWRAFRIGDLFDIRPTRAYKRTNSELLVATGNVPVVANSAQNNGVVGFSDLPATENGGIITFSDTTDANAIFYQAQPFIGYAHVQGMYPKFQKISDFGMLFLVSAFQSQALRMNFDYANKFRRDIALNIEICLPVTSDGRPDWAWMEYYMQQQMDKAEALVEHLDAVWSE